MAPTLGNINPAMIGPGDIVVNSTLGQSIETNVTTIDGGKITTGRIQSANGNTYFDLAANQIKMNNGSFTLDSTAAGTSAAPNIQGGYIKGGTIEGVSVIGVVFSSDTLRVHSTTSGNTGKILYSGSAAGATATSGASAGIRLYHPTYSTNYLANRITDMSNSTISVITTGSSSFTRYENGFLYNTLATQIEYSINGGAWGVLVGYALSSGSPLLASDVFYNGAIPAFSSGYIDIRVSVNTWVSGLYANVTRRYGINVMLTNSY